MVPYSGGPAQAMGDLMGGRVQMLIEGGTALVGAMQSGRLRVLAVGSEARLAEFPDLPTVAETVPNFRAAGWLAMVAPAGTPEPIVRKVSDDLKIVLSNPGVRCWRSCRRASEHRSAQCYPHIFSRSVDPAYFVFDSPRRCSSGTTSSTNSRMLSIAE
jgi:tripartite-type tricarboxylate transporter receptor subunit TctC